MAHLLQGFYGHVYPEGHVRDSVDPVDLVGNLAEIHRQLANPHLEVALEIVKVAGTLQQAFLQPGNEQVQTIRSLAKINYPFTLSGAGCNSTHHGTSPA